MRDRIYSLDAAKVTATIFIIMHHYQIYTRTTFANGVNFVGGRIHFEYLVELFFILSGFFMHSYVEKIKTGMPFGEFFVPKYLRFFLPRAVTVVVFSFLCKWYENLRGELFFDRTPTIVNVVQAAIGFSTGWGLDVSSMNGTVWYISVLLICYVLLYISVFIADYYGKNPLWLFVFWIFWGFSITTYNINWLFFNSGTARGITAFFWGLILAQWLNSRTFHRRVYCIMIVTFAFLCFEIITNQTIFTQDRMNYVYTFMIWPLLIAILRSGIADRLFRYRWIGWLSKISFEAYIWHFPVILLLIDVDNFLGLNITYTDRIVQVCVVVVSFLIGVICFYLVELPGYKWLLEKWRTGGERV